MRMSHIYQPVMLGVLLERGGSATIEEIAKALLSYDRSQVEYHEIRTKGMVGKVLTQNGIVEPIKDSRTISGYKLNANTLTEQEVAALKQLCESRLAAYLDRRGNDIWGHRGIADGYVPGSVRY
jgi:DNA-binding transcriptional ArsR family regulator